MKTTSLLIHLPVSAALAILLPLSATAAVKVIGEHTNTDAAYGSYVSDSDLVNAGTSTLSSGPTYSSPPHFGPAANNNGTVGTADTTADITFWLGAVAGQQFTITYTLDTTINTLGYDITSIQTIHGWTNATGNQKNQNYTVAVSTIGSDSFTDIATVAYLPFSSANNVASSKVTITEDATGILASNVDGIRFTYTVPASGGSHPSPTIREIDVFGTPTAGTMELRIFQSGAMLDFEWSSLNGKQYDLVSSTDFAVPVANWLPYNDGEMIYENIASGGLITTLTGVQRMGPFRFFSLHENDLPPLLSESFEGGTLPGGWIAVPASGDTIWNIGVPSGLNEPPAAASGTYCAGTNVNRGDPIGNYTASANAALRTPSIAIPTGGATLTFKQYLDTETAIASNDFGVINALDADSGDSFLGKVAGNFEGVATGWIDSPAVDLSAYAGMNIKLEFLFTSNESVNWGGWYIDDVLVTP